MSESAPSAESILGRLMQVIEDRRRHPPEKSYVTSLFRGGTPKIAAKIREEAEEVIEAADETGEEGRLHLIREAADVTFHLMVLLGHREVGWHEVEAELGRRFGISGIDEKASRKPKGTEENSAGTDAVR